MRDGRLLTGRPREPDRGGRRDRSIARASGVALAGWVLGATAAGAGSITLEIGLDCKPAPAPACSATVANRGPEAAGEVALRLAAAGSEQAAPAIPLLAAGETMTRELDLTLPPAPLGSWAAALTVAYVDANHHPLSAVAAVIVAAGSPAPLPVSASLSAIELERRAETGLQIVNTGETPLALRLRWHLPRELDAEPREQDLALAPGRGERPRVRLLNRDALAGSSYAVYAVLESAAGEPRAALVPGRVEVRAAAPGRARAALLLALAVLVVALLLAQLAGRRRS